MLTALKGGSGIYNHWDNQHAYIIYNIISFSYIVTLDIHSYELMTSFSNCTSCHAYDVRLILT